MAASYKGFGEFQNEAAPLVVEYNQRKMLSKIGYRFDGESLDVFKAWCFCLISNELAKLEEKSMKEARRKKGR